MAGKKTSKTTKATKTYKTKTPVTEPAPAEPVAVTEPVAAEEPPSPSATETEQLLSYDFQGLQDRLKSAVTLLRELTSEVSRMEKAVNRDRRSIEKRLKTKTRRTGKAGVNGFQKPGPVSSELRSFLGLEDGALIARTDVTKGIRKYCQEKSLQNEADKRIILADAPLRKLLRLKKSDELTYFNLQKYMKIHFPNKEGVFVYGVKA